jgi:hypothetical protein
MKFYGSAELQQNYVTEPALAVESAFPTSPVVGQLVFTSGILYICVSLNSGTPIWIPLTNEITAYTYNQPAASTTWTITHPLNTSAVQVMVYNLSSQVILPDSITINSNSQITITFGAGQQGKAVLVSGCLQGNQKPTYSYEYVQSSPSTTWVITHNLGRYPTVRAFVGYQEVQPQSITFNSLDQLTITFATAQTGFAGLI